MTTFVPDLPAPGFGLFLKLKSKYDGQVRFTDAAHIRLDGKGQLVLYDARHRITDRIDLATVEVMQIQQVCGSVRVALGMPTGAGGRTPTSRTEADAEYQYRPVNESH